MGCSLELDNFVVCSILLILKKTMQKIRRRNHSRRPTYTARGLHPTVLPSRLILRRRGPMSNHRLYLAGFGIKRPLSTSWLTAFPCRSLESDGAFRRQPSLGHVGFDDMPLHPCAMWASEGSQVSADIAWLDRRELHRRSASRTLRALVLCVEHCALP